LWNKVFIATLNLPDTLNFELAEDDVAKLSSGRQAAPPRPDKRQNLPIPNLLESLSRNTSSPPTASSSPTSEFAPGGGASNRREFLTTVTNALATFEPDGTKSQVRRKLTQPPSRVTSPTPPPGEVPRVNYGPGASSPQSRKRRVTVSDKMFADAKWTAEKQQFGVNGGLINAVKSAHDAGALQDYMWIGTLGMV
jgi:hypothetical protein